MSKKILGLDLGTNSIGWALIQQDFENKKGEILGMGSRIIPMDAGEMGKFAEGASISKTADRTKYRSARRLRERHLLRRERLHRVLNVLSFLPKHYANEIDFQNRVGQFLEETEPKLAWKKNGKKENGKDKFEFIFQGLFEEMLADFRQAQPELMSGTNRKGEPTKIPYDWAIYCLRKKALAKAITKEQLAWLILNFNQKRGYYQLRGEEEEGNSNKSVEFHTLKVVEVKANKKYALTLENGEVYTRSSENPLFDWKDTNHEFIVTTYLEKDGIVKKDKDGKEKQSFFLKEDLAFIKSKKKGTSKKNNDKVEEQSLKIVDVKEVKQDKIWYSLVLENGWIYRRESKVPLFDWKGKVREFIVTTDLEEDENGKKTIAKDKEGNERRSFRAPKEDDWTLVKKKTENDLENYISEYEKKNNGIKGTVGAYIYDSLLKNPTQKIRGKLVRTIERDFYKDELRQILQKQIELQPELFTDDLYNDCVRELYRSNEAHQLSLSKRDFVHLFLEDIIFYQRPLRSQKSSIGNCSLEYRWHKINKKDEKGNTIKNEFEKDDSGKEIEIKEYLKAIPKSNPYYQEFRVWQWLYNLKIYTKDEDKDVTELFIKGIEDIEKLFEFLMTKKEVNHKSILDYFITPVVKSKFPDAKPKALKDEISKEVATYRWNYVYDSEKDESKNYPMNETGYEVRRRLEKVENVPEDFLTREIEQQLWHIIYSVTDKKEYETALRTFANKKHLDETSFVENFKNFKPFPSDYGRYSEKAIKKLLPLMRIEKYWSWDAIDKKTKERIDKILTGEYDEEIKNQVREKAIHLTQEGNFQGLQLWLAQYVVYGRHSEAVNSDNWKMSHDIQKYLYNFNQHSLRNPIVEQVVTETLCVVKDVWEFNAEKNNIPYEMVYDERKKKLVKSYKRVFDEIHIELGRDMKNPAKDRERMTNQISENENTNLRIKLLLTELKNHNEIENVRPHSPMQQDILKIYEEYAISNEEKYVGKDDNGKDKFIPDTIPEDILKISKTAQPTKSELIRYKLWLEQKYRSPYTGQMIPLSKLFTSAYEIEHIIPKSRYFDDSFSNKVICESEVNKLKDNQLGLEFIKNHHGEKIPVENGAKNVVIFSQDAYKTFVNEHYDKNRGKKNKLLLEEIPDKMIERQLNDTRYISKFISQVLSNIVRIDDDRKNKIIADAEILADRETDNKKAEEIRAKAKSAANDDGVNSKNIIPGNGKITSTLKQDWGLNDVWNELILPRFERMNDLTQTTAFTSMNKGGHLIPAIPLELSKGFQKKRIDHRHHALDALVIACATSDHVNLLNNQSAKSELKRYDLQHKLRNTEKWKDNNGKERDKFTEFKKPWENFTVDAKNELEKIVVSFKQNLRVINKATNHYEKIKNGKKIKVEQKGVNWAIRKPMHKDFVFGKVNLPWAQVPKSKTNVAIRRNLDTFFDLKKIGTITDTGIQKILKNYLKAKDNNPELALSPEGIEELNKNITQYNDGKQHQPIYKVRTFEVGSRFQIGQKGNKNTKYVEAAKGTNLFFAIYQDENGKRNYDTIPLNIVIERQKQGLNSVPKINKKGHQLLFHLSPNDLVYVPAEEELINSTKIDFGNFTKGQRNRIYKFTDGSGVMANFISSNIAEVLFNLNKDKQNKAGINYPIQNEIGVGSQGSKNENAITGEQIKSVCIKLKVDRLGNISKANN